MDLVPQSKAEHQAWLPGPTSNPSPETPPLPPLPPTGALVLPLPIFGVHPLAAILIAPDLVLRPIPTLETDIAAEPGSQLRSRCAVWPSLSFLICQAGITAPPMSCGSGEFRELLCVVQP